jgi:hypothetical protein
VYDRGVRRLVLAAIVTVAIGCGRGPGSGDWHSSYTVPGSMGVSALWAFAPDDVWAGAESIFHFDGSAWTEVAAPSLGAVGDFWGFAPDDLYAVGGMSLLRWNGTAWSTVDFGGAIAATTLISVWGTSDDDLWLGDGAMGQVFHWDGTVWSTTVAQTFEGTLDLWGVPETGVPIFATSSFGMSRWDGSAWAPTYTGIANGAEGLWGFGASDVWAVGQSPLAHWDGAAWTDTTPVATTNFVKGATSVWGTASDDVWAVGGLGTIDHWDGHGWTQVRVGGAFSLYYPTLYKVHGSSADDVWAVGVSSDYVQPTSGVILHRTP